MGPSLLAELARPVMTCDAETALGAVRSDLSNGKVAVVPVEDGWRLVLPEAAVGYADTRLLVDLPLVPAPAVEPSFEPSEALWALQDAGADQALLVSEGRPVGCISREALLAADLGDGLDRGRIVLWQASIRADSDEQDPDLRTLTVQGPLREILGLDAEALRSKGTNWADLVHPEDLPAVRDAHRRRAAGDDPGPLRLRIRHADGHWVWIQSSVRSVRDNEGRAVALRGVAADISESMAQAAEEALEGRLYEVLSRRKPREALEAVSRALVHDIPADAVALLVRSGPGQAFRGILQCVRPDADEACKRAFEEMYAPQGAHRSLPGDVFCLKEALARRAPVYVPEAPPSCPVAGVQTCLVQPLVSRRDFEALLLLHASARDAFTPEHRRLVTRLAPALSAAVTAWRYEHRLNNLNAALERGVRRRTFELEVLHRLAQNLGTTLNYDDLFAEVVRSMRPILHHDFAATLLYTDEVKELLLYPRRPAPAAVSAEVEEWLFQGFEILAGAKLDRERVAVARHERPWQAEEPRPIKKLRSVFQVPLIVGPDREVVGILLVAAERPNAFTEQQKHLLHTVVAQASVSVQRLRAMVAAHERRLVNLVENLPVGLLLVSEEGDVLIHNRCGAEYLALLSDWKAGLRLDRVGDTPLREVVAGREDAPLEVTAEDGDARRIFEVGAFPAPPLEDGRQAHVLVFRDVTRSREIEEQVAAQNRLAAVGQLAAGVAHDFNNLLTIILAAAQFAAEGLAEGDPRRSDIEQIRDAARRATSLTRQLLAFSRRQVLRPEVLDLNALIGNLQKMLRRLIGEHIELATDLAPDLPLIKADPGQIEQVIMNLVVNARDAMPRGGKLTLETAPMTLDDEFTRRHPGAKAGRYVTLSVTDTGVGMDPETRRRAFEPFFTTKERGKGTGLGLSTVYGIVKQSGGYVWIVSRPGRGSRISLYLPVAEAEATETEPAPAGDAEDVRGGETVLIVEDEEALRHLAARALERRGYRVIEAADGRRALAIAEQHPGRIHLVLTDVVMPGPNGRAVADELRRRIPGIKVIYMSGYTDDTMAQRGVLEPGVPLVRKPFDVADLVRTVRETLDAAAAPSRRQEEEERTA